MHKRWTLCMMTLLCTALVGCTHMGVKQNAGSAYDQVRDQFSTQQSYAFYGRTKLLTENSANANMVNFSGRKDGDAVYMKVKLSVPDEKRVDTLSLLHQGDKLYAKEGNDHDWKSVAPKNVALQQELNNWSPIFSFQQMDEMKKNVRTLPDENPNDDVEAIRITLDSAKLKTWLATQMREQTASAASIQSTPDFKHKPKLKLAMALSDGAWQKTHAKQAGPSIQSKAKPDVNEIVDQMNVEADYTIYYNKKSMLPTNLTMSIRSVYDLNNQRVHEHSQVETFLQNYGRVQPLPTPAERPTEG
ncbi:hypothetical protein BRE01_27450 [Brevibacillus reuszeri]|uniref:Lipoprotein n=1 Tax=Brevibacillus reuszeri TaxID=54915 RepID=A0A0K9YIP6_9BACL|nr:hypothetical protein [Brevibacillus reuszeri]KNB68549.1 hypothetical protein ADS79_31725 [Brevibacillus reuszeri]MED1858828.1 hypothetical protein [Brevibacillus reuszeri]GED69043.1 hypothetical protein BRE01_27450 [Brevibacillus reuszeri]